ncbi:MAG: hypothetical protein JNK15_25660 [Planctomycetes bacterium]|nr:hypothetical protein [Planctomycetota bacterium]
MNHNNRIARHFAAAAAVVALAGAASAQVVRSPFVAQIIPNNIDGLYINVETGAAGTAAASVAGWDLNPYSATGLSWFHSGSAEMRFPGVTTGGAGNLNYSTEINAAGSFNTATTAVTVGAAAGNWRLNGDNYFGFRFTAADNQVRYGWGRFTIGASISGPDRRIEEIYYESTANTPIAIGSYGTACGSLGFEQSGQPVLGASFNHTVSNMPVTSNFAMLLLAAGTPNAGIDLSSQGWTGCYAYVDLLTAVLGGAIGSPSVSFPFTVPNNPAIIGFQLNAQGAALWIDGGGALQLVSSKGIASVIGA